MIKELLLSLAIAAFSGVSSFVGSPKSSFSGVSSPKRVISDPNDIEGYYYMDINPNPTYYDVGYENKYFLANQTQVDYKTSFTQATQIGPNDSTNPDCNMYVVGVKSGSTAQYRATYYFYFNSDSIRNSAVEILRNSVSIRGSQWSVLAVGPEDGAYYYAYITFQSVSVPNESSRFYLEFDISESYQRFWLTKNYINCQIASSPILPDNFTNETAPIKPSYYVLMVSNAGGYGFTSESVTQTGGIVIRNFNLFDQYNNSGYYASLSFTADLPFNDCSITIEAFLPTYTITTNLERCTVSPAIPSSYTGTSFIGDYTFTAVNGYGFNKNYTHWEVTNLFVDRVEFSNLLWGSFYSSVTLRLRASGGNSSISVTAIEYDEESYKLGYDEGRADGWQAGYDKGHADGEIAGNSYGVWNWLKQSAITTGEFLSINLLPGFSIGALLTALAGLMIIWLFIKGFLFKS